jgi:hypothetical protein
MGMPGFDVSVKFVFTHKSKRGTSAAGIWALEIALLRMAFQVTREIMLSRKSFPVLASRNIAPMGLYMALEMSIQVGNGLECDSGFSRSTARPLARTWNSEVLSGLIAMAMKVLSEVFFTQERLLFAGWPFTTH